MKFIVSSSSLLSHLQAIGRVINSKNSMPILDNFLFGIEGKTLTMTASDQETTITSQIEVMEANGAGSFAISAKILLEPLRELPDQPLTFEINDDNLEIYLYFQNGKYNFIGVNGDDYPQTPVLSEDATSFTLSADVLLNGISRTLFAAGDDELRPIMNGVYFDIFPSEMVFVASDSHKLVRLKSTSVAAGITAAFILPKKPASLLKGILPKESGVVTISFDDRNARFTLANFEVNCRLIEGRYPNYASVIPQNNPNKLTIERVLFTNVLRRVSVFSNQASNLVKLALSDNKIKVTAQDIDFSTSAEEYIPCEYQGDHIDIGFKSTFLVEILNNISAQEVTLELADASRAGLILPQENQSNEELLMLLMPMMLTDF